jgi:peptidoglycan/xylan/chitin deacetylase (PgdA/CDA1 family)
MYAINTYTGSSLPHKVLCLTFDDGPGEHTLPIAQYLFEQDIRATFFVVGKYAIHHPEILQQLKNWNHIIANHTYEHPDMPYYVSVNGNVQDQIMRTDAVIKPYIDTTTYFRAPYGKWTPEVAAGLNASLQSTVNHLGPIHWDIAGVDCWYWQTGKDINSAVDAYLKDIAEKGRGIVVFHDEIADMDYVKPANKTLQLLQQLVPQLKQQGYTFTGLDEIETIKQAAQQHLNFKIEVDRKYLSLNSDNNFTQTGEPSIFNLEFTAYGKVIITVENNLYIGFLKDGYMIKAGFEKNMAAVFDYIPVTNNRFMLRATTGNYLFLDSSKVLTAGAPYMRQAGIFSYIPVNLPAKTKLSAGEKIKLFKKRLAFIRSKLAG